MTTLEQIKNGAKWNYKFYGNYLYVNGKKTNVLDNEKMEIIEHVKHISCFALLIESLEMVSGSSLQSFTPTLISSNGDWILNVKETDHHENFNCIFRLYFNHKDAIEFPMNFDFHATPKSKCYDKN